MDHTDIGNEQICKFCETGLNRWVSAIINILIRLEMDYMQQPDSASLVQAVECICNHEICRKYQQQLNLNSEVQILMPPPVRLLPLVAPHSPQLGVQLYVQPQTQTQTRVFAQRVDMEQFQLVEEDQAEDIIIPPTVPRITEAELDNRFGGDNGSASRTDNYDRPRNRPVGRKLEKNYMKYLLRWTSRDFLTDPQVVANVLPMLEQRYDMTKQSIKRKLLWLEKRPFVTLTDMYYRILDPSITDPFKNAFARYIKHYLEYYLQIEARKSKLKDIESFKKYHRRITAYLAGWKRKTVANLDIKDTPQNLTLNRRQ